MRPYTSSLSAKAWPRAIQIWWVRTWPQRGDSPRSVFDNEACCYSGENVVVWASLTQWNILIRLQHVEGSTWRQSKSRRWVDDISFMKTPIRSPGCPGAIYPPRLCNRWCLIDKARCLSQQHLRSQQKTVMGLGVCIYPMLRSSCLLDSHGHIGISLLWNLTTACVNIYFHHEHIKMFSGLIQKTWFTDSVNV